MNMHLTAGWISILRIGTCWDEEVYREIGLGMSDDRLMNHKLHIILSVVTLGFWVPIYAVIYFFRKISGAPAIDLVEKKQKKAVAKEQRRQEIITQLASQPKLGYKKGGKYGNPFTLACNHSIVASAALYSGVALIGKEVYCDVCKETRRVTASIRFP